MLGIVACETLYDELRRLAPGAAIELIPQWYHEFPIHAPESERIHGLVQERIHTLERNGVDEILVLYHDPEGVAGVRTSEVPLYVHRGGDCIELFLTDRPKGPHGERKAAGTYYLTGGLIDVGLDCYKVYRAYAGEIDDLIREFEEAKNARPGMRTTWPESERIQNAIERSERMRTPPETLVRDVVSCYHHVVLLDTGNLHPFHRKYAEEFCEFVADVGGDDSPSASVALSVVEGDTSRLKAVLESPDDAADVDRYPPETPVEKPAASLQLPESLAE